MHGSPGKPPSAMGRKRGRGTLAQNAVVWLLALAIAVTIVSTVALRLANSSAQERVSAHVLQVVGQQNTLAAAVANVSADVATLQHALSTSWRAGSGSSTVHPPLARRARWRWRP